jgi:hypothetical protein
MISLSNNCCRVDAVKASANQLKLQLAQQRTRLDDSATRSATQELLTVDAQIKTGDANKAELALANAKLALTNSKAQGSQAQHPVQPGKPLFAHNAPYGQLDIRV